MAPALRLLTRCPYWVCRPVQLFTFLPRGIYLTDERNFDSFTRALLVNFQCLTGDGWSGLMNEARGDETHASSALAVPFFVSFQVLCSSVILNLVVAVILENFTSLGTANTDLISRSDIEIFSDVWADFDPDADQSIPIEKLPDLLKALPQPMGLAGAPRSWVVRVCLNLGLRCHDGQLRFRDVLDVLVKFNFQQQMLEGLPPPGLSDKAAAVVAAGASPPRHGAGSSLLWSGVVTEEKLNVARVFAVELLRLSHGTKSYRRTIQLPRAQRLEGLRTQMAAYQKVMALRRFETYAYGGGSGGSSDSNSALPDGTTGDVVVPATKPSPAADTPLVPVPVPVDMAQSVEVAQPVKAVEAVMAVEPEDAPRPVTGRAAARAELGPDGVEEGAIAQGASSDGAIVLQEPRSGGGAQEMGEQPGLTAAAAIRAATSFHARAQKQLDVLRVRLAHAEMIEDLSTATLLQGQIAALAAQMAEGQRLLQQLASTAKVEQASDSERNGSLSYTGCALSFTLEGDLATFTAESEAEFLARLAQFGGVQHSQLVVLQKRAGSIIVDIAVLHSADEPHSLSRFVESIETASLHKLSTATGMHVQHRGPVQSSQPAQRPPTPPPPPPPPPPPLASDVVIPHADSGQNEEAASSTSIDPELEALWSVYDTASQDTSTADSAALVQAMYRGHRERGEVRVRREMRRQQTEGAQRVQALARGRAARDETRRMRERRQEVRQILGAPPEPDEPMAEQAPFDDPELEALWSVYDTSSQDTSTADSAALVQAMYRGHRERGEVRVRREMRRQQTDSARLLQAHHRGHLAREEAKARHLLQQERATAEAARAAAARAAEQAKAKAVEDAARAKAEAEAAAEAAIARATREATLARTAAEAAAAQAAQEATAAKAAQEAAGAKMAEAVAARAAAEATAAQAVAMLERVSAGDEMLASLQMRSDDFLARLHQAETRDSAQRARDQRRQCRDCGVCGICLGRTVASDLGLVARRPAAALRAPSPAPRPFKDWLAEKAGQSEDLIESTPGRGASPSRRRRRRSPAPQSQGASTPHTHAAESAGHPKPPRVDSERQRRRGARSQSHAEHRTQG